MSDQHSLHENYLVVFVSTWHTLRVALELEDRKYLCSQEKPDVARLSETYAQLKLGLRFRKKNIKILQEVSLKIFLRSVEPVRAQLSLAV